MYYRSRHCMLGSHVGRSGQVHEARCRRNDESCREGHSAPCARQCSSYSAGWSQMINRTEARYSETPSRAPINRILPSSIPRQVTFFVGRWCAHALLEEHRCQCEFFPKRLEILCRWAAKQHRPRDPVCTNSYAASVELASVAMLRNSGEFD